MPLPSGYTQVEYIETSGTQYIDTGFKPNQNTRVVIDFHATSTGKHIFGARTSYPNNAFAICWESNAGWCLQVNNNTFNGGTFDTSVRHTIDMTASTFKLDGETKATYSVGSFQTVYNLYLASCPNSETRENMIGKIYSCQVYDNGRLIRDYVPCKNSSNEAGMYDQANGVFYRNAGSGTFGVGAVVDSGITGGGADPANFTVNARVTVGGVGKKLTNGYVVVAGVLKQILRAYVYMNGELVSLNIPKPKFTWKKYNVVQSLQYKQEKSSDTVAISYTAKDTLYASAQYTFDSASGIYTLTNAQSYNTSSISQETYKYFISDTSSSGSLMYEIVNRTSAMIGVAFGYVYTCYQYTSTSVATGNAMGSYISDVTADTENAYPANGIHTDGYWYVKQ